MRPHPRSQRRGARLLAACLTVSGLALSLVLVLAQIGIVPAGADDRSRDGAFGTSTGAVSAEPRGGGSSPAGASLPTVSARASGSTAAPDAVRAAAAPGGNVTICHATGSTNNPYGEITVPQAAVDGITPPAGDHYAEHQGPLYPDPNWGDIIPPVPGFHAGLNWSADGQAILANGCAVSATVRVTKSLSPAGDPGTFALRVDGSTVATGGNGTSGSTTVQYGSHTISELGAGGTNLADYTSSISCSGPQGASLSGSGTSLSGHLVAGSWTCTISNTRRQAILSLSKQPSAGTVSAGGNVTWTITVTNSGTLDASNVTIADTLPSGFAFVSASAGCANNAGTVTCTIASVPANGNAQVTIETTAPTTQCGRFTNTVVGTNPAIASATAQVEVQGCVGPQPNLSLSKVGTPDPAAPGATVTWTITVTNTGAGDASNVTIADTLPPGFAFVSASAGCANNAGTVTCTIASVPANGNAQVTIETTAPTGSCADHTNVVVGTNPVIAQASDTVTVLCADVTLSKSGPATVGPNATITWTITAHNAGNAAAHAVQVVDTLPAGFTYVSSNPAVCSDLAGTVTCTLGTVNAGSSTSVDITATAPSVCGPFSNSASGSYGTAAPVAIPPVTHAGDVVGCGGGAAPNLTVAKTADASSVNAGGPVGFTIVVGNNGNADALNVQLNDALPGGLSWSISPAVAGCSIAGGALQCSIGTLVPSGSFSVHVSATSSATSCGVLNNTATATASNAPAASGRASISLTCPPGTQGLVLVKDGPATARVGDTITYTFTVTLAPGSPPVSNVTISDPVCDPAVPQFSGPSGDTDGDGTLEANETWTYTCTHVVTTNDPDPLPNTATVCAGTVCDSDDHVVDVIHPDIALTKGADPTSATPGTLITYTYRITNTGDVPLFRVTLDDDVLGHVCSHASIPPGGERTCAATYRIPTDAPVSVVNVAVAEGVYAPAETSISRAGVPLPDQRPNSVRATASATVAVVAGATVRPTRSAPGGLAFTGPAAAVPLVGVALLLLMTGTGMLWAGRRRGRHAPGFDD